MSSLINAFQVMRDILAAFVCTTWLVIVHFHFCMSFLKTKLFWNILMYHVFPPSSGMKLIKDFIEIITLDPSSYSSPLPPTTKVPSSFNKNLLYTALITHSCLQKLLWQTNIISYSCQWNCEDKLNKPVVTVHLERSSVTTRISWRQWQQDITNANNRSSYNSRRLSLTRSRFVYCFLILLLSNKERYTFMSLYSFFNEQFLSRFNWVSR